MITLQKELESGAKLKATAKADPDSGVFTWELTISGAGTPQTREIATDLLLEDLRSATDHVLANDLHRGAEQDPEAKLAQEVAEIMGGWEVTRADGSAEGDGEN